MDRVIAPATGPLRGHVRVPGDKSISHRAVLFAAMAEGTSELDGVLDSADVRSSISAVTRLGARVAVTEGEGEGLRLSVTGWGASGPSRPESPVDCGNSGTTARLLLGILSGWDVVVTLVGDASLSTRPMRRVTDPLSQMGARFESATGGTLPVTVSGRPLIPIRYALPVASAQVKSAILLAGLRASGRTVVTEPASCRDHTERLLPAFGIPVLRDDAAQTAAIDGPATPAAATVHVPADPSSAAFMAAAALVVAGSRVVLPHVALNPTRVGFLRVFEEMGADVLLAPDQGGNAEPVGTIEVHHGPRLAAMTVKAQDVPALIDEVPVLAVVATQAEGTTRFEGVGELRVKESDRLQAVLEGLTTLGATVRAGEDWLEVDGPTVLRGCALDSLGDHRLAMAWAVAGLCASGPVTVHGWDAVAVSYPCFAEDMDGLRSAEGGS